VMQLAPFLCFWAPVCFAPFAVTNAKILFEWNQSIFVQSSSSPPSCLLFCRKSQYRGRRIPMSCERLPSTCLTWEGITPRAASTASSSSSPGEPGRHTDPSKAHVRTHTHMRTCTRAYSSHASRWSRQLRLMTEGLDTNLEGKNKCWERAVKIIGLK